MNAKTTVYAICAICPARAPSASAEEWADADEEAAENALGAGFVRIATPHFPRVEHVWICPACLAAVRAHDALEKRIATALGAAS